MSRARHGAAGESDPETRYMQLTEHHAGGRFEIRAVESGRIRIQDQDYTASLILSPEELVPDWPPRRIEDVTDAHLQALLDMDPEVVLLGTGEATRFPPARVFAMFQSRGIGLEVMDTRSACRTYNVLASELRRVVAGLML